MTKVIDASIIVKLLTEELYSDDAAAALASEPDRIAPEILAYEVSSALSKKVRYAGLSIAAAHQSLAAIPNIVAEQVSLARLSELALSLSIELRHAFYDCLYLALAEQRDSVVLTADAKFIRVVSGSRLSRRVEPLVPGLLL